MRGKPYPPPGTRKPSIASSLTTDRSLTALGVIGVVLLTVRRWALLGPFPTGLDGAQWLALGRGYHGFGRDTEGAYAPLAPLLATALDGLLGPLPALRILATLSALAVTLSVWHVAHDALGAAWGLAVAALVVPASGLAEPVFYGGYAQELALAAGVVAVWQTCRYLTFRRTRNLGLAGAAALIAALSHHLYYPIVFGSIVAAVVLRVAISVERQPQATQASSLQRLALARLASALAPSLIGFGGVAVAFVRAGYAPPLQGSARSLGDGWQYGMREAPEVWAVLLLLAMGALIWTGRDGSDPVWLTATGLMIPAGALFLATGQPRLIPPILVGAGLALGVGARTLARSGHRWWLAAALTVALAVTLGVRADQAATAFAGYYRVGDASLVAAAGAIAADDQPGAVAVRKDRRGWPVGWWFEALLARPIVVGSDTRWLGFPEEQERAVTAEALFNGEIAADAFRRMVDAASIRYLVMPKWDWIGWDRWLRDADFPVSVLYDDDRYLVLRVE
jgi:hypothetical protein